jgi:hypothetical protein
LSSIWFHIGDLFFILELIIRWERKQKEKWASEKEKCKVVENKEFDKMVGTSHQINVTNTLKNT